MNKHHKSRADQEKQSVQKKRPAISNSQVAEIMPLDGQHAGPKALSRQTVEALQRTVGNQAVTQLIRKNRTKDSEVTLSNVQASTIQRALASPRFAGDATLEQIEQGTGTLKRGQENASVNKIQHGIHDAGVLFDAFGVDGKFGRQTERRVRAFQRSQGVTTDPSGEVGQATIKKLDGLFPAMALPATASDAYTFAGMLDILRQWNSAMIQDLRSLQVQMVGGLSWADERFDGTTWQPAPTPGAGETSGTSIIIATNNTNDEVAKTLYHEYQHARSPRAYRALGWADEEQRAYTMETQWAIDRGLTVDASLTTTDPVSGDVTVDDSGVDAQVETYPGLDAANPGEVTGKVGANRVRVRMPNGRVTVRNAVVGDTVPGGRVLTAPIHAVQPAEWV